MFVEVALGPYTHLENQSILKGSMDNFFFPNALLGNLNWEPGWCGPYCGKELLELLLEVQAIAEVVAIPF